MTTNVIMPQMGESVAEGTIIRWMKKVGDRVERDEPLFEISTDKVDAEIPSPTAGRLRKILVKENETVEVNTVVAEIEDEGAPPGAVPSPAAEARPRPSSDAGAASPAEARVKELLGPGAQESQPAQKLRSSPVVRQMARQHDIDLTHIRGTGLGGRISKKDVLAYLASRATGEAPAQEIPSASPASNSASPAPAAALHSMVFTAPTHVAPMTAMRRQIAEHMVTSKRTSPHVASVFEVEMTKVAETRARHGAEFERRNGIRLTYTPFFVKAAVRALKQFPIVNSSLEGANVVYRRDVNIGVAVALETGLIVPVIKHADEKSFLGVARAVQDLAGRARSKRLSVDEVQEGTFTISNHGVFGSLIGTPIIHQPQVAILGVGAIGKRAVVRNDAIAIRTMVYLTLSFDHRVLDGAIADQFMATLKDTLENWDEPVL